MSSDTTTAVPFVRVLRQSMVGLDVLATKRALIKAGKGAGVALTTRFGSTAVAQLEEFQRMCELPADGVYGPATHKFLSPFFDAYGVSLLLQEQRLLGLAYRNPYRDVVGLRFAGYDQGVDFSGSGHVYAVGPARVCVSTTRSGWPGGGAVSYTLTSGKASGKTVYLAENITPLVAVGDLVAASTPVATMHDAYPYTESGWAEDGTDTPMSQPISHVPTHFGANFGEMLISLGEGRCPRTAPQEGTPLPAGWPVWLPET